MLSRRGGRRLAGAYLLGAGSVLAVQGLLATILLWPPTNTVDGSPHTAAVAADRVAATEEPVPAPARTTTEPPPVVTPAERTEPAAATQTTQAQAPGTVRLPGGSVAHLVRQDVVDGVLPVPQRLDQAAWWGAALAAQRGATVLAGHVNWGGRTGPFAELWTARIGQAVTVVDGGGKLSSYRISQLFSLQKDELPQRAGELFAQTGAHRLVLVTCGGEWVGGEQGYAENRVVVADVT
ncbi:MAG TPA: class F sortase [Amycolatopsis sp.]|uniref:class F sortase n=1 Tax=Amycolatopsis sp. TaxID=37632 RepID=UPI002B49AB67|nr:class F sortase [Amycolatopsis sp.]HKS44648.1 class F sortase [Amycolatopsis sp.]